LNERIRIPQPTGELLPAEERLQNVLKAIEDRLLEEQEYVFALEENGLGQESGYHRRFVSGLDIAWSLAQTEALRRQSVDGVPDLLPPAP
jgi:hypothetical protein